MDDRLEPLAQAPVDNWRFEELVTAVRSGAADLWGSLWLAVIWSVCERVAAQEFAPDHPNVGLAIEAAWDLVKGPPGEPPAP